MAIAIAALVGAAGSASALGLGPAVGDSILGETLQIQVPLTGSVDGPIDQACVSIRRPADAIDPEYFPRDLAVRVDNSNGTLRLLVASRTAIRQPLIQFGVSVTCGYNLARDYLIAVSPRERTPQPVPAGAPAAVPQAQTTAMPASAGSSQAVATATTPDGVAGRNLVLDRDMTLEELARQHFPGPLRQGRFMRWVAEANPQLFSAKGDIRAQRLAAGTQLLIPVGVPPRRPGDYQNGSSPLDKFGKPGSARTDAIDKAGRSAAAKPTAKSKDRLVVGSGGTGARDYKETVALVQRLTGMLEQQVATQSANEERIHQLEAGAEELKAHIAQVEAAAKQRETQLEAQLQAERQAAQRAQEDLAQRAWWQMAIAVLVGGGLAAVLIQSYRMWAARKSDADPAATESPPAAAKEHEPAVAAIARHEENPKAAPVVEPPRPAAVRSVHPAPVRKAQPVRDPLDFEPPAFLHGDTKRATAADTLAVADVAVQEIPDPAKAAIELANIMTSMGLTESAAQTLVDHIRENPRQSLQHWLKLLELHRLNGKREDYERSSQEMRQHFNVQAEDWAGSVSTGRGTLEAYPHVRAQVTSLWHDPGCVKYLHSLLMDNREGTRSGFPLSVAEEILLLIAVQSDVQ